MKNRILLTSLAFLAGAAIGSGVVYKIQSKKLTDYKASQEKPNTGEVKTSELSPYTVALTPKKYVDKEIEVSGYVQQTLQNTYILTTRKADQPLPLTLDFSQSGINPSDYAAKPITPNEPPKDLTNQDKSVTITGTLKEENKNNTFSYVLQIKSIK